MEAIATRKETDLVSIYSPLRLETMPTYITESFSDLNPQNTLRDIYQTRENIVWQLSTGHVLVYRETNAAVRFEELATELENDCMFVSSPNQVVSHASYREIVGMGGKIIPLLIKRLDNQPTLWLLALQDITGLNPIKRQNRGNIPMVINDWKNWYKKSYHGRISRFVY